MRITKSIVLFISLLLSRIYAQGQEIRIIDKNNDSDKSINTKAFDFIDNEYNLPENKYIATLSGFSINSGKSILSNLFNLFWKHSNDLGANSFKINNVINRNDTTLIEISIYNLTDEEFDEMITSYPANMVYIVGDIDKNKPQKRIKFNNKNLKLAPLEFIAYQNEIGKDASLSIGGLLGAKVWIKGQENRLPKHYSLSGFGIGPGYYNEISVSFNTGRIYPLDLNFGQFLIKVLNEKK